MKAGIRTVAREHLLHWDPGVAGAEKMHQPTRRDCLGAHLAGPLNSVGLRALDLLENLDARLDPAGARVHRCQPATAKSTSTGSQRPLFIER